MKKVISRLTNGIYDKKFPRKGPFGLRNYQLTPYPIIRNAGWFNIWAHRLGVGSMNADSFKEVQVGLLESDIFILTPEDCSSATSSQSWSKMVDHRHFIETYGVFYITKERIYFHTRFKGYDKELYGLEVTPISTEDLKNLLDKFRELNEHILPAFITT